MLEIGLWDFRKFTKYQQNFFSSFLHVSRHSEHNIFFRLETLKKNLDLQFFRLRLTWPICKCQPTLSRRLRPPVTPTRSVLHQLTVQDTNWQKLHKRGRQGSCPPGHAPPNYTPKKFPQKIFFSKNDSYQPCTNHRELTS